MIRQRISPSISPQWIMVIVWILRILVGGVFVTSGFVKMVDPWGFIFKIEEYLAIWGMVQPRTVVLMVALFISGYEFVLGALFAFGCYKRTVPWGLLLSMAFMLPLTLYIWLKNPVEDCGCFGDFITISNAITFWKNVVLTALLIIAVRLNSRVHQGLFQPAIQWIAGAWISLYALIVGLYGFNVQPLIDFRSFPVGTNISTENSVDEDTDYMFIYEKDGYKRQFTLNELPDSTWTFVDRVAVGSTTNKPTASLTVYDTDDTDITDEAIFPEGREIMLLIPEPARADMSYTYMINEMYEYATEAGIPMIALLGGNAASVQHWQNIAMAEYPCYIADDTQLKELARGTMSVVMINDGVVESKNSLWIIDPDRIDSPASLTDFVNALAFNYHNPLPMLNLLFAAGLVILYVCQGLILGMNYAIKKFVRGNAPEGM